MPFRFRRSFKVAPGIRLNVGNRGITSATIGRTNFRRGYTPRTTIRLFPGLSWFFGGKKKGQQR
jgi:hypothetical protein